MSESPLSLSRAPIVEAVLDIECDLPVAFDLAALESQAIDRFKDPYPNFRTHFVENHRFERHADKPPAFSSDRILLALQFRQNDEKQLVQIRSQGFAFNRLAPYKTLDDYLPEIERTWRVFVDLAQPIKVRADGKVDLRTYFNIDPQLPADGNLQLVGFLNQHTAIDSETGNQVNIILATEQTDGDSLPVIFDIEASRIETGEPANWPWILARIQSLRGLKNRIFRGTLTPKCLQRFQ